MPNKIKVWIEIDNSPHVPFFRFFIDEFKGRGCEVVLTCRDCFETVDLLNMYNIKHKTIGKHYGKNSFKKIWGMIYRSVQLYLFIKSQKINIAISHGSRSQYLTASLLNIPLVALVDYEGTKNIPIIEKFIKVSKLIFPEAIDFDKISHKWPSTIFFRYPGIKEDVYLSQFNPDPSSLKTLSLDESKVITVLRPPASQAHYHNPKADKIFKAILKHFSKYENTQTVLLARTEEQNELALTIFKTGKGVLTIPTQVVNGLDLLWASDLVISGGGTMVREGAGLGVPAYSIFCGQKPDVDSYLESKDMLTFIQEEKAVDNIKLVKRDKSTSQIRRNNILPILIDEILNVL